MKYKNTDSQLQNRKHRNTNKWICSHFLGNPFLLFICRQFSPISITIIYNLLISNKTCLCIVRVLNSTMKSLAEELQTVARTFITERLLALCNCVTVSDGSVCNTPTDVKLVIKNVAALFDNFSLGNSFRFYLLVYITFSICNLLRKIKKLWIGKHFSIIICLPFVFLFLSRHPYGINRSINVPFRQRYKSSNRLLKRIPKQLKFDFTRNNEWTIFKTNPSGQWKLSMRASASPGH